nr:tRNA 2'-phosphotransferase 1 [Drosophila bipectinata]
MPPNEPIEVRLSKKLSWLLRHGAKKEGIPIQADGFVNVSDLANHPRFKCFTLEKLQQMTASDAKQRYTLRWNQEKSIHEIRANQGHSLAVLEGDSEGLERITHPSQAPQAVHGTYYRNWDRIKSQGLKKMNRNHVHFASSDTINSILSGFRSDCQILIYLNVEKILTDKIPLFLSSNKVILCSGIEGAIPPKYFLRAVDRKTGNALIL